MTFTHKRTTLQAALVLIALLLTALSASPAAADKKDEEKRKKDDGGHELIYGEPVGDPNGTARETPPDDVTVVPTNTGEVGAAYLPYPLKHSFSLSHTNYNVPYSCHIISGTAYYCRLVYGYEEAGSGSGFDEDYLVLRSNTVSVSDPYQPNGVDYARAVIYSGGSRYEGCYYRDSTYLHCDYWTPKNSERPRNTDSGYWVKILKDWSAYTYSQQAACAYTLSQFWKGQAGYQDIANDCGQSPFVLGQ